MSDMQKFDDNIIENLLMFSFKDDKQIYTNGVELVPLYRVVQILEHFKVQELVDKHEKIKKTLNKVISACINETGKVLERDEISYIQALQFVLKLLDWSEDESK